MGIQANFDRHISNTALAASSIDEIIAQRFHWLDSLPIATAIYRFEENQIGLISQNNAFEMITQSLSVLDKSEMPNISFMIAGMIENGKSRYSKCWQSKEFISYRQLDINIARYNQIENMFIVSFFDKT